MERTHHKSQQYFHVKGNQIGRHFMEAQCNVIQPRLTFFTQTRLILFEMKINNKWVTRNYRHKLKAMRNQITDGAVVNARLIEDELHGFEGFRKLLRTITIHICTDQRGKPVNRLQIGELLWLSLKIVPENLVELLKSLNEGVSINFVR